MEKSKYRIVQRITNKIKMETITGRIYPPIKTAGKTYTGFNVKTDEGKMIEVKLNGIAVTHEDHPVHYLCMLSGKYSDKSNTVFVADKVEGVK